MPLVCSSLFFPHTLAHPLPPLGFVLDSVYVKEEPVGRKKKRKEIPWRSVGWAWGAYSTGRPAMYKRGTCSAPPPGFQHLQTGTWPFVSLSLFNLYKLLLDFHRKQKQTTPSKTIRVQKFEFRDGLRLVNSIRHPSSLETTSLPPT